MAAPRDNLLVPPQAQRGPRWRALRALLAEVAWLDAPPIWREGRALWSDGRLAPFAPTADDLALARLRLARLERLLPRLGQAIPDARGLLRERRERLAAAALLARQPARLDIPALVAAAHQGSAQALGGLAALVCAEAICREPLPHGPARAILGLGEGAAPTLLGLAAAELPPPVRALAALLLGALGHGAPPAGLRAAWAFGAEAGLCDDAALLAGLLAAADGPALARRLIAARPARLALPVGELRALLLAGRRPAELVATAEALAAAEPVAAQILALRPGLRRGRVMAEHRRREHLLARIAPRMRRLAVSGSPEAVAAAARVVGQLLYNPALPEIFITAAVRALDIALDLPAGLQAPWLALVADGHEKVWCDQSYRKPDADPPDPWWVERQASQQLLPLAGLLRSCGDPALLREIFARRLHHSLARHPLAEPGLYRWVLRSLASFEQNPHRAAEVIARHARILPPAAARGLLAPALAIAAAAPVNDRTNLLEAIMRELPHGRAGLSDGLRRLARHAPALAAAAAKAPPWLPAIVPGLLTLDRLHAPAVPAALSWLAGYLGHAPDPGYENLRVAVQIAAVAAGGEQGPFQELVVLAQRLQISGRDGLLERGLAELPRLPALAAALRVLLPQQPRRCVRLLSRVGLTARLGPAALAALAGLEPAPPAEPGAPALRVAAPAWADLLALAPALDGAAAAYIHARWVVGESLDPPPGVRRAADQPRRTAAERAHLARLVAAQPQRPELAARLANLDARLADEGALAASAAAEAAERLGQALAEAQLTAAEAILSEAHLARLATIVGPLPPGFALSEDMTNAILLSLDISSNRGLLRRLLRAHFAGEAGWREAIPANAAFLADLAGRGADVAAWLGAWPEAAPCPALPGGRIHLHLEQEPLAILQMGNVVGTCLSLGGVNAFSAVANACELNKRIVYARDSGGHIVGRQLLGVSDAGAIVGYQIYTTQGGDADRAVRAAITRYVRAFAERCRLPLADAGNVRRLIAQEWYDDGEVAWDDPEEPGPSPQKEQP